MKELERIGKFLRVRNLTSPKPRRCLADGVFCRKKYDEAQPFVMTALRYNECMITSLFSSQLLLLSLNRDLLRLTILSVDNVQANF